MEAIAVSNEVKVNLIQGQIEQWRVSMENARIACVVAETIQDAAMKDANVKQIERCVKAIEKLESMLKELEGTNEKAS